MSSLYSLLQKGRRLTPKPDEDDQERFDRLSSELRVLARRPNCILVNAQSVAADMVHEGLSRQEDENWNPQDLPAVTPPFGSIWLEFAFPCDPKGIKPGTRKYAVQTSRTTRNDGQMLMDMSLWMEYEGSVLGPCCYFVYSLTDEGRIDQEYVRRVFVREKNQNGHQEQLNDERFQFVVGTALQALSRMHCKNVELRPPIPEGKFRPHPPNVIRHASVWHEIVVTSVPKVRSGGKDIFEKEEHEIRAHWIRGHYADYRKGKGLFGNPKLKGLYWIPEYRKGNEELGQVIPEYTIQ